MDTINQSGTGCVLEKRKANPGNRKEYAKTGPVLQLNKCGFWEAKPIVRLMPTPGNKTGTFKLE